MSRIVMSFGFNQGFGSGLILNGGLVNFALIEKRRGEERRGKNRGKGIKGGKLSKAFTMEGKKTIEIHLSSYPGKVFECSC